MLGAIQKTEDVLKEICAQERQGKRPLTSWPNVTVNEQQGKVVDGCGNVSLSINKLDGVLPCRHFTVQSGDRCLLAGFNVANAAVFPGDVFGEDTPGRPGIKNRSYWFIAYLGVERTAVQRQANTPTIRLYLV